MANFRYCDLEGLTYSTCGLFGGHEPGCSEMLRMFPYGSRNQAIFAPIGEGPNPFGIFCQTLVNGVSGNLE